MCVEGEVAWYVRVVMSLIRFFGWKILGMGPRKKPGGASIDAQCTFRLYVIFKTTKKKQSTKIIQVLVVFERKTINDTYRTLVGFEVSISRIGKFSVPQLPTEPVPANGIDF